MNTVGKTALTLALIAGGVMLIFFMLRLVVSLISPRPDNLGLHDGILTPCPSYPNCVSSQSADEMHAVKPIPYAMPTADARVRILRIINTLPRATVITEDDDYIHAEFRTAGLRQIDDVEFYFDEETRLIQVRSAARLPYYDFQINRRRVEYIRDAFLLE